MHFQHSILLMIEKKKGKVLLDFGNNGLSLY